MLPVEKWLYDRHLLITRVLLFVIIVAWIIRVIGIPEISNEAATAITVFSLSYILYVLVINSYRPAIIQLYTQIYENQDELMKDLYKILEKKKVKEATLIQYSGKRVTNLTETLLRQGARVNLWLMNPEEAISVEQKDKIKNNLDGMPGDFSMSGSETKAIEGELLVYQYDTPASIRGALLDDDLLIIGWYTYEHILVSNKKYSNDRFEISGHDRACILLDASAPGFLSLKQMFERQCRNYEKYWNEVKKNNDPLFKLPESPSDTKIINAEDQGQGAANS